MPNRATVAAAAQNERLITMTTTKTASPELRAQRAAAILAVDPPVTDQGIDFVKGDDTGCTMSMTIRSEQCNSHGICHGGVTMMLADTAAAYALNTGEETPCWVTSTSQSTFIAPGKVGHTLFADAQVHPIRGRSCLVDIRLTDDQGAVVLETRNMMVRLA